MTVWFGGMGKYVLDECITVNVQHSSLLNHYIYKFGTDDPCFIVRICLAINYFIIGWLAGELETKVIIT